MDDLKQRIRQNIVNLESRIHALNSQKKIYQDLKSSLQNKLQKDEKVTIAIGDGWFADYTINDAQRFLDKRIALMEKDIKTLGENTDNALKALGDLSKLDEDDAKYLTEVDKSRVASQEPESESPKPAEDEVETTTNEGLPLMEIREELDDDDNVISSSVQPQNDQFKMLKEMAEKTTVKSKDDSKEIKDKTPVKTAKPVKPPPKTEVVPPRKIEELPADASPKIEELQETNTYKAPIETPIVNSAKGKGKEKVVEDDQSAVHHSMPVIGESSIATQDLLELELINSEFDDEEDLEFDEDFEEDFDDDDDDDDDYIEEDEHGKAKGPLIEKLSRQELEERFKAAERALEESRKPKQAESSSKRVSFASEVEVKQFDKNNAANDQVLSKEEAEPEPKPKKISRFKAERMGSGSSKPPSMSDTQDQDRDRVTDIMERPVIDKTEEVEDDEERPITNIVERAAPAPVAPSPPAPPKPKGRILPPSRSTRNSRFRNRKPQPMSVPAYDTSRPEQERAEKEHAKPQELDEKQKLQKRIDERAKQLYQDAIVTEEQFLQAHDVDDDNVKTDSESSQTVSNSRPILETTLVERDPSQNDNDNDDQGDSDTEYSADMAAIASEYQRLRSKLINQSGGFRKTDEEKAVEQIDENGNEIKVSRFKAANFVNRK